MSDHRRRIGAMITEDELIRYRKLTKFKRISRKGFADMQWDMNHLVEMRPENERFSRVLELLGEWYDKGKVLIFVESDEKCDALSKDLLENGYPSFSLLDYDTAKTVKSIISDFINKESSSLLIATSDASTDLDLKDLQLVINYDLPSDFGHLCCRFGIFGTCCAVTFMSSGNDADARYAPFLVDALERCNKPVPDDLKTIADEFNAAINKTFDLPSDYDYDGATFAKTFRLQYDRDMFMKPDLPLAKPVDDSSTDLYREELDIVDFPEYGRWKVAHKDVIAPICAATKAHVINFGNYLYIGGPTNESVKWGVAEVKFVLQQQGPASLPVSSTPVSSTQPDHQSPIALGADI